MCVVGKKKASQSKKPKSKCCVDTPRCKRCPIRMLKEGTLPSGYTVHKRRLVKTEKTGKTGRKLPKAA